MKIAYLFPSILNRIKRKKSRKPKDKVAPKESKTKLRIFESKYTRYVVVLIFVIGLSYIFVLPVVKALAYLDLQPAASQGSRDYNQPWRGKDKITTLFLVEDKYESSVFIDAALILVYDPGQDSIALYNLNPDISIYVRQLKATLNIRTVFSYPAAQDHEIEYIIESIENLLALRIDRYITIDLQKFAQVSENFEPVKVNISKLLSDKDLKGRFDVQTSWPKGEVIVKPSEFVYFLASDALGKDEQLNRQNNFLRELLRQAKDLKMLPKLPDLVRDLSSAIKTDMSEYEFILYFSKLSGVNRDKVKLAYTQSSGLIKNEAGFGFYQQYSPIIEVIDEGLSKLLVNSAVLREQARIEVLNGTNVAGLAGSRSRWISNFGGRVIYFGNSPEKTEITKVYVDDKERFPETLAEIEKVFNYNVEYPKEEYAHRHLGDIVVVIGGE